jgi:uncharacterized protein
MNQAIRNYLGIALIVASVAFAYGVISYAGTYSKTIGLSARSFAVEGSGEVAAVPDIAQFTFGVLTEGGDNLTSLQDENATRVNRVIEFLKSNGVGDEDIKTQRLNISPRYSSYNCFRTLEAPVFGGEAESLIYPECPPQEIIGYTINQSVEVKVRNMDKVGDIFAGVVENGANTASNLRFTIDDTTELENQARAEAIEDARTKAESTAEAGGFRVGKLLSIDEFGNQPSPIYGFGVEEAFRADSVSPDIEPGTEEISVSVIMRYEIK